MTPPILRQEFRKTAFRISALLATFAVSSLLVVMCRREPSFIDSLRCGMTRDDVTRLARAHGYDPSDPNWLTRAATHDKERILIDLTFRNGRLIAVREKTYDPRTKKVVERTIELCPRVYPAPKARDQG